uniref:Endothelial differentiation-related factor 1 n=1 Tax=Eptatretus burgeri TaxID=7764 RepID=A0A8C4NC97_EPTBU
MPWFLQREAEKGGRLCLVDAVAAAQRKGQDVETTKKWSAGQNKQHVLSRNTAKLDRETEELHHTRVPMEVGKLIQKGRQEKGLNQKDLATRISEKPQIVTDYEVGRAIPNNVVLGKIERVLGECCAPFIYLLISSLPPGVFVLIHVHWGVPGLRMVPVILLF